MRRAALRTRRWRSCGRHSARAPKARPSTSVSRFTSARSWWGRRAAPRRWRSRASRRAGRSSSALVAQAEPNSIVVSEAAVQFLEPRFDLLPGEAGPALPGRTYRLVGLEPSALEPRRRLARFVGRGRELELVQSQFAAAGRGHGQVVGIVGEAGIGKTRLVTEFRQALGPDGMCLEAHCLSYGTAIPYLPLLDIVRSACGLLDGDAPETLAAKVRERLPRARARAGRGRRRVSAPPPGSEDRRRGLEALSPEAVQARTFETLRQLTLRASRRKPLALVVENLHWIDRASEEFLASLVEVVPGAGDAAALHVPARVPAAVERQVVRDSDRAPAAGSAGQPRPRPLRGAGRDRLGPAGRDDPRARRGQPVLPGGARARGGGADSGRRAAGCARDGPGRPLARISRLSEEAKWALQTAAVLGREVPLDLLRAIWTGPGPLEPQLRELTRLEFLHGHGGLEEPVYFFKHALTREVAYESLMPSRRRELHAAAGEALERLYAGRLEEIADRLAHHFARAERALEGRRPISCAWRSGRRGRTRTSRPPPCFARRCTRRSSLPAEEREGQLTALPSASPIRSTSSASFRRRSISSCGVASRPRDSPIRPSPRPGISGSATCGATWATTSAPTRRRARRSAAGGARPRSRHRSARRTTSCPAAGSGRGASPRASSTGGGRSRCSSGPRRAGGSGRPTGAWRSTTASWASSSAGSRPRARPSASARRSRTRGSRPTPRGRSAGSRRPGATGRSASRRAGAASSIRRIR